MTTSCVGIFLSWRMNLTENPEAIRLNEQEEVEALLGPPPGGLLRWGMGLLAGFLVLLLVLAWLVRYPDVLQAPVILITENAPLQMQALQSGRVQLLVAEGEQVEPGQRLAVLQTAAELEDVLQLENWLTQQAEVENVQGVLEEIVPKGLQLGALQPDFSAFRQKWEQVVFALNENQANRKIAVLERQQAQSQVLQQTLQTQITTLTEELTLSEEQLQRTQELFEKDAMSQIEVDVAERNFLQTRRQLEALQTQVVQNDLRQTELQLQILDLLQAEQKQLADLWQTLHTTRQTLQAALKRWKTTHLFMAPAAGTINLGDVHQSGDFVQQNQLVLTFLPQEARPTLVGKAMLPLAGAGKVEVGDSVNIQLADFPYREFGQLRGAVAHIAPIVESGAYELTIAVPQNLETTYGEKLEFKQEMQGRAEVVTEKRRLLARIVDRGKSLLNN